MDRKLQQQFLIYNLRKDKNKKYPVPIKIIERKKEPKTVIINNSFSEEFINMPQNNDDDEIDDNILAQSYSFGQINKYREKFLNEPSSIILESFLYSKTNGGKMNINKKIKFITPKDASELFTKLLNKNKELTEEYLKKRIINQDEKNMITIFKDKYNETKLKELYSYILKCDYSLNKFYTSNNVNPLFSLKKLFEEMTYNTQSNIHINYSEKFNKLNPIIYRCRKIKGDGNCYYRAVMFRYFEQIILNKNIILLKKIILEMNQAFQSKEIQSRFYIKMNVKFKPDLHLYIMFIILDLLEKNKVKESYEIFIKCILSCAIFDYGLILYFRYILYLYIQNNETKLYSESFKVKIGNFLPSKYENEKGEFEFQKFYANYLLKMFMEAEKIIIYLTPFVLGINLDIIIFEDNEDKIVKRLSYEEENGIDNNKNNDIVITLLNRNAHYELVYTHEEYMKFSDYYKSCEILDNVKKEILVSSSNSNYFLFQSNLNEYKQKNKTAVFITKKNKNGNNFNNESNVKTVTIKKRSEDSSINRPNNKNIININNNSINSIIKIKDNGSKQKTGINQKIKITNKINSNSNNLTNKDNNENNNEDNKVIEIEMKNKRNIKLKSENEIPFGHPEYKADETTIISYIDSIDNMFLKNFKYVECLKCHQKETYAIQDNYQFCNQCLKKEIVNLLAKDYSNYLINNNIKTKKYKVTFIKLYNYTLSIKNILDILRFYTKLNEEKDLNKYIKQFVCLQCFKVIDEKDINKIKFPCGCAVCNKDDLQKYFTEGNPLLSDEYQCLCGYKYTPKDFYELFEECYKITSDCICLLIINIFHKNILSKGCCGCGNKKKEIKINYKADKSNLYCFENYLNKSHINLDHFMCTNCEKKYQNQEFICFFCKKIHFYYVGFSK